MTIRNGMVAAAAMLASGCMASPTDQQFLPDGPDTVIPFKGFAPASSPTEANVHVQALNVSTGAYETVVSTTSARDPVMSEVVSGAEFFFYPYSTAASLRAEHWRNLGGGRLQATIRTQFVGATGGIWTLASFVNDQATIACVSPFISMGKPVTAIFRCATDKAAADVFTCATPPCAP